MTSNTALDGFIDDIHAHLEFFNAHHAEAYDDISVADYSEVKDKHSYTIVIGVDVDVDVEPSLYSEFVNSLDAKQRVMFQEVLELIRGANDE